MVKKALPYVVSILVSLGIGGLSAILTSKNMSIYQDIIRPLLSPPSTVFPIVWTILFVLMGIAAAIVFEHGGEGSEKALYFYGLQLVLNFCWSIIFFNFRAYFFAFVWLLLLLAAIILTTVEFGKINKKAAYLMVPYILWVSFAGYLNFAIWLLNR